MWNWAECSLFQNGWDAIWISCGYRETNISPFLSGMVFPIGQNCLFCESPFEGTSSLSEISSAVSHYFHSSLFRPFDFWHSLSLFLFSWAHVAVEKWHQEALTQVSNKKQMVPPQPLSLSLCLVPWNKSNHYKWEGDRMSKYAGFPRGSAKQHPLKRNSATVTGNTKACWLVTVYEHGAHSTGDCPNLINEMMMLTGYSACCISWLTQVGKFPPEHQFSAPLSDNCLWKDERVWQSRVKEGDVYVVNDRNNQFGNNWHVCVLSANWGALVFLRHLVFISRLVSDNSPRSPMNKYWALPRHN